MRTRGIVLLLTATVDPGRTLMVARRDPLLRLGDYQHALRTWLSKSNFRVVVCENSGYDLSSLRAIAAGSMNEVEFISSHGNDSGASKGKGHAELEMIKHALKSSELLKSSSVIVKCTGRLTVRNAAQLLDAIACCDFDVMCTLKTYLSFADSRLFAATPAFFEHYLVPRGDMIDDTSGATFEHILASAIGNALADRKKWRPFPRFPVIDGVSGTDGLSMSNTLFTRLIKIIYSRVRNFVYGH